MAIRLCLTHFQQLLNLFLYAVFVVALCAACALPFVHCVGWWPERVGVFSLNMLGVAVKSKRKEPKRAGEDAVIGYGAHERGGSVTAVVTALGCDDRTAISLLAKHGGDHSAVIRAGTR